MTRKRNTRVPRLNRLVPAELGDRDLPDSSSHGPGVFIPVHAVAGGQILVQHGGPRVRIPVEQAGGPDVERQSNPIHLRSDVAQSGETESNQDDENNRSMFEIHSSDRIVASDGNRYHQGPWRKLPHLEPLS